MTKINFIQIGANQASSRDFFPKVVKDLNWNGIFVEPIEISFNELVKNYKHLKNCYFENSAIHTHDGVCEMYSIQNKNGELSNHRKASLTEKHINKHYPTLPKNMEKVKFTVNCITMESLAKKYSILNIPFNLLQIDAEGFDGQIIQSIDFKNILPEEVRFERIHLSKEELNSTIEYLKKFGYKNVVDKYLKYELRANPDMDLLFCKT